MYFDSVAAAIAMDGHGGFVWSAYALTALVLLVLVLAPWRRRRRLLLQLRGQLRREQAVPHRGSQTEEISDASGA